jgi:exportin-T
MFNSGLHTQNSTVRSRVFYLFHRFVKETKADISADLALTLIDNIRDLLSIEVEIPESESEDQTDFLAEAVQNPGLFDSQLYLFETTGTLLSILYRASEQHSQVLHSVVDPLSKDLSISFHAVSKDPRDVQSILKVHHVIMAMGNIAKGFPEFSVSLQGSSLPPFDLFGQIAQAILVCLEAMSTFKVVRDAVRHHSPPL